MKQQFKTLKLNHDLILVGGGRVVSALVALVAIRASTTLLGPDKYGELALLITIQLFCGLFLINPVGQHINLHTHVWWDEGVLAAKLKPYRLFVFSVALGGGMIAAITNLHQHYIQLVWTVTVVFSLVATATWNATLVPMLNMLGFRGQAVLWSIVTVVFGLIFSIVLTLVWASAVAWLAGQAIGMFIGALGARTVLCRHKQYKRISALSLPFLDRATVLSYCMPLSIATGLMWLQLSGYRFIIETYWGLATLGFMVVGLQVANQVFLIVESIFSQFLYPMFYRQISDQQGKEGDSAAFSDLINTLAPLYLVLAGFVVMGAPYLLKILVAPQFHGAIKLVMLGAGIELCRVLGNLFGNAAQVTRKTHSLAPPYAAGAVTTLALVYLAGVTNTQIEEAVVALNVSAGAMLTVMWWRMNKQINFKIDVRRWLYGTLAMAAMAVITILLPRGANLWMSLVILIMGTIVMGLIVSALLWKNPAVDRLLNVKLRKG